MRKPLLISTIVFAVLIGGCSGFPGLDSVSGTETSSLLDGNLYKKIIVQNGTTYILGEITESGVSRPTITVMEGSGTAEHDLMPAAAESFSPVDFTGEEGNFIIYGNKGGNALAINVDSGWNCQSLEETVGATAKAIVDYGAADPAYIYAQDSTNTIKVGENTWKDDEGYTPYFWATGRDDRLFGCVDRWDENGSAWGLKGHYWTGTGFEIMKRGGGQGPTYGFAVFMDQPSSYGEMRMSNLKEGRRDNAVYTYDGLACVLAKEEDETFYPVIFLMDISKLAGKPYHQATGESLITLSPSKLEGSLDLFSGFSPKSFKINNKFGYLVLADGSDSIVVRCSFGDDITNPAFSYRRFDGIQVEDAAFTGDESADAVLVGSTTENGARVKWSEDIGSDTEFQELVKRVQ